MDTLFAAPIGALLIFLLRVVDVSMATVRLIHIVRGRRLVAAVIGFVEVLIWLFAVGHALQHLDSLLHIVGYAGGFGAGTYVGIWLEGHFGLGTSVVRAVSPAAESTDLGLGNQLRGAGYAVTEVEGRGRDGPVVIFNTVVPRREVAGVLKLIRQTDPDAFVTVEEVRSALGGHLQPGGRKAPFL